MIFKTLSSSPVTKRFLERRVLETNPKHLFRVIQDVDSYSQFLPLCSHSEVLKVWDSGRVFEATLTVGIPWGGALQEQYTSRVSVNPELMTIETISVESKLFDSLRSRWKLKNVAEGCDVDFEVEMTVSDAMIAQVLDKILEEVAGHQVEAFDKRCREIPVPADLQQTCSPPSHSQPDR